MAGNSYTKRFRIRRNGNRGVKELKQKKIVEERKHRRPVTKQTSQNRSLRHNRLSGEQIGNKTRTKGFTMISFLLFISFVSLIFDVKFIERKKMVFDNSIFGGQIRFFCNFFPVLRF